MKKTMNELVEKISTFIACKKVDSMICDIHYLNLESDISDTEFKNNDKNKVSIGSSIKKIHLNTYKNNMNFEEISLEFIQKLEEESLRTDILNYKKYNNIHFKYVDDIDTFNDNARKIQNRLSMLSHLIGTECRYGVANTLIINREFYRLLKSISNSISIDILELENDKKYFLEKVGDINSISIFLDDRIKNLILYRRNEIHQSGLILTYKGANEYIIFKIGMFSKNILVLNLNIDYGNTIPSNI